MPASKTFSWQGCHQELADLASGHQLVLADNLRSYRALDDAGQQVAVFSPPMVLPILGRDAQAYLTTAEPPGLHAILLLQAGATALGIWHDDELLDHKVIKKYVVRGKGRAQPLHLKTKGKSRYGSRLRLQEARKQLVESNQKLIEYWAKHGTPRLILYSAPVRTWPELFRCEPSPPFDRQASALTKIPLDVHQPCLTELARLRRKLGSGTLEWRRR